VAHHPAAMAEDAADARSEPEASVPHYEIPSNMRAAAIARRAGRRTSLPGLAEEEEEEEQERTEPEPELEPEPEPELRPGDGQGASGAPASRSAPARLLAPTRSKALPIAPSAVPGNHHHSNPTAVPSSGGKGGPNILRRGSQMLSNSLAQFNQGKIKKRRMRRLSLKQSIGTQMDTPVKDLLLPASKTRAYWEMFIVGVLLSQAIYTPYAVAFHLFPARSLEGSAQLGRGAWVRRTKGRHRRRVTRLSQPRPRAPRCDR
jgi:hypothetical protein